VPRPSRRVVALVSVVAVLVLVVATTFVLRRPSKREAGPGPASASPSTSTTLGPGSTTAPPGSPAPTAAAPAAPEPSPGQPRATPTSAAPRRPAVSPSTTLASPATTTLPGTVRAAGIDQMGGRLYRDGRPYAVIGLNAPQAATLWSVNYGCGTQMTDTELDLLLTSVPKGTVIGFWATQAMAYNNRTTNAIDFAGIDRVFAAAERNGQLLAPVLETQQGFCSDGHFKDEAWYGGGYRAAFDDDGLGLQKLSYWDYLHLVVPRYRASKVLAWWVPVTEPESSTCGGGKKGGDCYAALTCKASAAGTLRRFFDEVGGEIVRLDPDHLLSSGTIGGGQCGAVGDEYTTLHASPALDICEAHDYDDPLVLSDGMRAAIQRCRAAGKAFVAGEVGLNAGLQPGCPTTAQRRDHVVKEADAIEATGGSGMLLWQWLLQPTTCGWGIGPGDPLLTSAGPR
jgi:mannan endo-1,4-beta-mannosidase